MNAPLRSPEAFAKARPRLEHQYQNIVFVPDSGWSKELLEQEFNRHCAAHPAEPRIVTKAWLLKLLCEHAAIAAEPDDYFVGKIRHFNLLLELRGRWRLEEAIKEFGKEHLEYFDGSYTAQLDCNSHVCPDWATLLTIGFCGVRDRAAALAETSDYHRAVAMVFDGVTALCRRFDAVHPGAGMAELAERPPQTFREALQMSYLYHELVELDGIQVRSMGRFDQLYNGFFTRDLADGTLTRPEAAELLQYYWIKFFAKTGGMLYGKPFTFGPVANELSSFAFEVYGAMKIHDPKFHVRVSHDTQADFLALVSRVIRDGSNAVVLVNSDLQEKMLIENGRTPEDAGDYLLIGCYEPAVQGKEMNCSGAGFLNLAKPVEQIFADAQSDWTYDEFERAYFRKLRANLDLCIGEVRRWEKLWPQAHPAPLLSGPMTCCHEKGRDVSSAGACYNTTGICCGGLADAVDSLVAVREMLRRKLISDIPALGRILRDNWRGHEMLRAAVRNKFPSWGNDLDEVDELAVRIANAVADRINTEPNARGGVFQAALYAIIVAARKHGEKTGALPNGRLAGAILTMNTNCEDGRDRGGATGLLHSAAKLPLHRFPNGTTLDVTLHPSAVAGEKGVATLQSLFLTYFAKGGAAVQFNIFGRETLLDAQKHPDHYANLQVRVCGWNLRFVDLAPEEQQIFIDRAAGENVC